MKPLSKAEFNKMIDAGLTPEEIVSFEKKESGNQVIKDLAKGAKDIATLPADYLNQIALDVPRQALERFAGKGAWEANFGNNIYAPAQKALGVAGALQGGGVLLSGVRNVAQAARSAGVPRLLTRGVAQGATAGAVEGAIRQPEIRYTPENVGTGAVIGGLIGGGGVPLMQGLGRGIQRTFSGVPKSFEEFAQSGFKPKIKQKLTPEQQLTALSQDERRLLGDKRRSSQEDRIRISTDKIASVEEISKQKQYIQSQVDAAKKIRSEKSAERKEILGKIRDQGKADLNAAKTKLEEQVTAAVRGANADIQKQLPSVFAEASGNFGARLEAIDSKVNLKPMQVRDFFTNILNDSSVKGGRAFAAIASKAEKYGLKISANDEFVRIDGLAKPVSVKELLEDVKDVGKSLSSSAKSGGRWSPDDIPYAVMNDHLSGLVPELAELRSSYRPILLAMKEGARIFKPSMGDAKTQAGEQFLRRFAKGKTTKQDEWLMKMISQPSKFSSGLGDIAGEVKNVGNIGQARVASIENALANKVKQVEQKYARSMAGLKESSYKWQKQNRDLAAELQEVSRSAELAKLAVASGDVENKAQLAKRMSVIAAREIKLKKLRNAQAVAGRIQEAMKYTGLAVTAGLGANAAMRYGVGRGSQALEDVGTVLTGE